MSIVIVSGVGGHLEQGQRMAKLISSNKENPMFIVDKETPNVNAALVLPRVMSYDKFQLLRTLSNFMNCLTQSIYFFRHHDVKLLISTGPAFCVPVFLVAKFFGIKRIHVESWSRIRTVSNTTRLMYAFKLADKIFVQYKEHPYLDRSNVEYIGHL
jgi:beta-1,4-N-acetylglucosaminyltransferase